MGFPAHAGMDPPTRRRRFPRSRLPRTRGDGPAAARRRPRCPRASPHTRGWTVSTALGTVPRQGFPAHAGMDPPHARPPSNSSRLPRTRGDGPGTRTQWVLHVEASPHTRGWTLGRGHVDIRRDGFPAHAGMDPGRRRHRRRRARLPRTRGDGPGYSRSKALVLKASPHTRGWTPRHDRQGCLRQGFPAHAGMDLFRRRDRCRWSGLPRTRGDGPHIAALSAATKSASPHTRGWTRDRRRAKDRHDGFPAHAGMDRHDAATDGGSLGLPRTRGDGPAISTPSAIAAVASPHTRGWTHVDQPGGSGVGGFPAHAGMDRDALPANPARHRLPRTRGDGPEPVALWAALAAASPHTRGWTQDDVRPELGAVGFPAHAGMDRSRRSA